MSSKQIVYLSHGGGPLPLLNDPGHRAMVDFMRKLPQQLERPEAIIVVSAHWEEALPNATGSKDPGLFYDYYGFPSEAYAITYPVKGEPVLAQMIQKQLEHSGIPAEVNAIRELDHGVFIPLKLMVPKADIPVVQISLKANLDPGDHIAIGKSLRSLPLDHILVIGSGFSFHNMREFRFGDINVPDPKNDAFQDWLIDVCTHERHSQKEREQLLIHWEEAPHARYCHPREEHLLPLHVCLGLADGKAKTIFDDAILGKRAVAFMWGA